MTSDGAGRQRRGELSRHPTDRLIRDLIETGRRVTPEEIERIIERMATAPFEPRVRRVRPRERGASYLGQTLGAQARSLAYHLIKRVVLEKQWAEGTTEEQYLSDLRRAVRSPDARLAVYRRQTGAIAATLCPTSTALPPVRRGADAVGLLLVVYSADRGIMISGYQISALDQANIPQEALWLR